MTISLYIVAALAVVLPLWSVALVVSDLRTAKRNAAAWREIVAHRDGGK